MVSLAALLLASCDPAFIDAHDADTVGEDGDTLRLPGLDTVAPSSRTGAAVEPEAVGPALRVDDLALGGGHASPVTPIDTDETGLDETGGTEVIDGGMDEQPAGFHFAFTHDSTYVVLRARTEPEWGKGPLALAQRTSPTVVVRAARAGVPSSELTGTRMVLRREGEVACVAELGAPQILRRAYAAWERYAEWNGEEGDLRASDAQVAAEAWELAAESELLVAKATPMEGNCAGAHWAHPEHASPHLGAAAIGEARVVRAFRQLEGYHQFQSAWSEVREYDDHPGFARWDARPGAHRRILTFGSHNGRDFALVTAMAHDGCGDFTGALWALFEVTSRGLEPIRSENTVDAPVALADLDGDGAPEILFYSRLTHASGDSAVDVTTPYFDCPC